MADNFASHVDGPSQPSRSLYAVVPHDSNELPVVPKALYVGSAGHVRVRAIDDSEDVVFQNVPAGAILRVRARYVKATGTTASAIVAHC